MSPVSAYDELPPDTITRWFPIHKAAVAYGIVTGLITKRHACQRYKMTSEELDGWVSIYQSEGMAGFRTPERAERRERKTSSSLSERDLLTAISERFIENYQDLFHDVKARAWQLQEDLKFTNRHIMPLNLKKLLKADDISFAHDSMQLSHKIDRINHTFREGFEPRCGLRK